MSWKKTIFLLLLVGCSAPKPSIEIEGSLSGSMLQQLKESRIEYKTIDEIGDVFLNLPPPPLISIKTHITYQPPATAPGPPPPPPNYSPLLALLRQAPGGSVITKAQLKNLTPTFMAIAPAVSTMTFQQFINSPQASQVAFALQAYLPQSLFNAQVVQWLILNQSQVMQQLLLLANQLTATQIPGGPLPPLVTIETTTIYGINTFKVFSDILEIIKRKDKLEIAWRLPKLFYALTGHAGYEVPQGVLYFTEKGKYDAGVVIGHPVKDGREVYVLNSGGAFVNPYGTGSSRYWQGENDLTLAYLPFKIEGTEIITLDSYASDRFIWLKKASGGNENLLDRATTRQIGLLNLNLNFDTLNLRAVGGVTPSSSLGGVMGEFAVNSELASFRVGGGGVIENKRDSENFIGYLDIEASGRTKYLEASENESKARTWLSLTFSASAMASKTVSHHLKGGKKVKRNWGLQGDFRVFPEIHGEVITKYVTLGVTSGATLAVVPGGKAYISTPEKSLGLYHIRTHLEAKCRFRLSNIADQEPSLEELIKPKTDSVEEKMKEIFGPGSTYFDPPEEVDEPVEELTFLDLEAIVEKSALNLKAKARVGLEHSGFGVGVLGEFETRKSESQDYLFLGVDFNYKHVHFSALKSVHNNEYRVEAGLKIVGF